MESPKSRSSTMSENLVEDQQKQAHHRPSVDENTPEIDPTFQPDSNALEFGGAMFAIVSTIIGGGIVGLPFGFQQMGIWYSIIFLTLVAIQQCNTACLYLSTKDLIEGKPESLYEIGYMLYSRSSIYFISGIYAINSFGLCMVYYITFSEIVKSLFKDILGVEDTTTVTGFKYLLCTKETWVIGLAIFMLPICLKKDLQELHIVSATLFYAIMIFIFIVFLQLCIFGNDKFSEGKPVDFADITKPYPESDFFSWVKSICCILVAFAFSQNLFPLYSALRIKTNQNCQKIVNRSVGVCFFIYFFLAFVSCLLFGEQVTAMHANIILNINREHLVDPNRWESFLLRALFMVVLACHVPFIFFSGKEGMLIILDEHNRRSISKTLDERVKALRNIDRVELFRQSHFPSAVAKVRVSEEELD